MINKQANILFIPTSVSGNSAKPQDPVNQQGYYGKLIHASLARSIYTIEGFKVLGRQLVAVARQAWAAKHLNAVEQASLALLALPIADQLEGIARYYQALCTWRRGDITSARQSLERVVEEAPPQYRARALQIIGLTYHECGEVDSALPFYMAAGRGAPNGDLPTLVESQRLTAVVRSIHGDHKRALADLERLFPPVRAIARSFPVLYYEFLNSLAVELGEAGRISEAEAALAIALASPFASAYPEWSATRDEIAARRFSATPSVVAINRVSEAPSSPRPEPERKPKRIGRLALNWPVCKASFLQRATKRIAVTSAIPHDGITQSVLDRLARCIRSRAPPAQH